MLLRFFAPKRDFFILATDDVIVKSRRAYIDSFRANPMIGFIFLITNADQFLIKEIGHTDNVFVAA